MATDAVGAVDNVAEVLDHLLSDYAFEPPYDRYLNADMEIEVFVTGPDDGRLDHFAIAEMKAMYSSSAPFEKTSACDNGLTWLVEQQGYPVVDLKTAYQLKQLGRPYEEDIIGPFIVQVAQELENFPLAAGTVAALTKVRMRDLPLLFSDNASLTLPAGTTLGLLAAGDGISGGFGIRLVKPLEIPSNRIHEVQVEDAVCDLCTAKESTDGKLSWIRADVVGLTAQQSKERDQVASAGRKEAMENEAKSAEFKGATWTPWAQVLCPEHIGRDNFPNPPSEKEWQQWTAPAALEEGNAVTFCDSCGDPVQLRQQVAEEHNLVYELRSMGFEASMGQTGGMNSACLVDIADEAKWDDEVESPDLMYICYDEFGDKTYYVEVHSEEGIVAETDWSEMSFPDKESLMAWINDNSEKLAPLEPEKGKTVDELMKEAKEKLSVLRPEGKRSLDDLIKEAKEKAADRTPDPEKPPRGATKQAPDVER